MADFKPAIAKVLLTEGGYANDPNDSGGETFRGIARKFWGQSKIWPIIDHYKLLPGFPGNLSDKMDLPGKSDLQNIVMDFYRVNFWNKIGGDNINNQSIADLLVDSAVNEGVSPAVKRAEEIVGLPQTGHITDELIEKLNMLK